MLSGQQFYYRTIRRNVIAFGTIFKDLQLVTYSNDDDRNELKRIIVPLMYGDKEDWYIRLKQAPTMPIPTDLPLPRMQFRITNYAYDASRKQQSQLQQWIASSGTAGSAVSQYVPVPWNLDFELQIFVRNTEDGLQCVEQILPYFTPEYTLSMSFIYEIGLTKNIPVVLNNVSCANDNEGATDWTMRRIVWTLNFTMQTYLFGPVQSGAYITQANTNIWYFNQDSSQSQDPLELTLQSPGFNRYQLGETVYQGNSISTATAIGTVQNFIPKANILFVYCSSGAFVANQNVHGILSTASWNVNTTPVVTPLATINVSAYPSSAVPGEDFGFTTIVTETPNTY
jgi:hypothetical protein